MITAGGIIHHPRAGVVRWRSRERKALSIEVQRPGSGDGGWFVLGTVFWLVGWRGTLDDTLGLGTGAVGPFADLDDCVSAIHAQWERRKRRVS